ncbi:Melibiose operon regulatory protein [compost metagenome]
MKAPEESLLTAYEVILEASMLKFLDGVDRVYSEQDLTLYEDTIRTEMDEEIVKELIQSVRLGNQAMVQNDLKQLTDYMRGMTYAECKLQLTHLIYELMKSFKQLDTAKGMEGIQHTLDKFQHLNGAIRWIEDFLHGVIEDLKLRSTYNRKEEIATEAVQYVMNNLHNPMLSTDMIADHTSVSVSYVRQVFKEWMDCTLSDFILNQRMERVKVLLATTESTVAEIAEQTGFQSKSHFFTAFKKATGLTPVQYRSQSLE